MTDPIGIGGPWGAIVGTLLSLFMAFTGASASPDPVGVQASAAPATAATASGSVRLMVVGDMMLARGIGERIRAEGNGAPFRKVQSIFDRSDLLIGNLECVVSTHGTAAAKLYTFRARPRSVGRPAQGRLRPRRAGQQPYARLRTRGPAGHHPDPARSGHRDHGSGQRPGRGAGARHPGAQRPPDRVPGPRRRQARQQ